MQDERTEAYKVYMSDALFLINTALTHGEIEIPRYVDIFEKQKEEQPTETAEQVYHRFDKLRRR